MKILFVCTGNTCRSPMAEVILNKYDGFTAKSCGIFAFEGNVASLNSTLAVEEIGLSLVSHKSQSITQDLFDWADLVLCMSETHKREIMSPKTFTIYEYALGKDLDITDPFGRSIADYRQCRDELCALIEKIIKR